MSVQTRPAAAPPQVQLLEMSTAHLWSRALWVAAEFRIADHLGDAARPVEELASETGTTADILYRILRFLASRGVFEEVAPHRFSNSPLSLALRSDDPSRARAAVLLLAGPAVWSAFGEIEHAVRTGEPSFNRVFGSPVFAWLAQNPDAAAVFNDAMIGIHGGEAEAVARAYNFSSFETVVDVGGGTGNLLRTVLDRHQSVRGVLFEMPHVAEQAREALETALPGRCRVESGNFFETVPAGGDAYILSHIIHDWDEASCVRILSNCRAVIGRGGKVLIVEMVIPAVPEPHPGKALDMVMIAMTGGRERTAEEYATLVAKAGLHLTRVVPTVSPVSVVEAAAI